MTSSQGLGFGGLRAENPSSPNSNLCTLSRGMSALNLGHSFSFATFRVTLGKPSSRPRTLLYSRTSNLKKVQCSFLLNAAYWTC